MGMKGRGKIASWLLGDGRPWIPRLWCGSERYVWWQLRREKMILRTKNSSAEVFCVEGRQQATAASYLVTAAATISRKSTCIEDAEKTTTKDADVVAAAASRLRCPSTGLSPAALPTRTSAQRPVNVGDFSV